MRKSLAALVLPALTLVVVHCGSTEENAPGDGGGDHATLPGTDDATTDMGDTGAGTPLSSDDGGSGTAAEGGGSVADAGRQVTTVGSFVGVNGLITDTVANLAPIGVVREYHNWGWLGNNYSDKPYPQTLYTPNIPDFGWDWDGFFAGLQAMGVSGFPAG